MKRYILGGLFLLGLYGCGGGDTPTPTPVNPIHQSKVQIGTEALPEHTYLWEPSDSLDDATKAQPYASPKKTTTYTVTAKTKCGESKSQMTVKVYKIDDNGELVEVK